MADLAASEEEEDHALIGAVKKLGASQGVATCAEDLSLGLVEAGRALRRVWFLALLGGMFHVFMILEVHIYLPYLYTRVHCCKDGATLTRRYDITEPQQLEALFDEARVAGLALDPASSMVHACAVPRLPPSSRLWSLSPSCVNRAFVQDTAQGILAGMKPLQKLLGLLVLPVGGATSDAVGRRPVLAAYVVFLLVASGLSAADTRWHASWGDTAVYVAGMLLCASFQPKDAILSSGIADVVGQDETAKSRAFGALAALTTLCGLICTVASYAAIRLHLSDYCVPWLLFAGIALAMLAFLGLLPETLPESLRRPLEPWMLNPLHTQLQGVRLLARDPVLLQLSAIIFLFWAYFIGFMCTKVSYLINVGFTIEQTALPEILAGVVQIFLNAPLIVLLPRLGVWFALVSAHVLWAFAFACWGPLTILFGAAWAYLANILNGAALFIFFPAVQTILSQRVEAENQGKCQSALSAIGTCGAIIGVPIYNHVLFSATAHGLARARPVLTSMALALLCCGLSLRAMRAARVTQAAAESKPASEVELQDGI